MEKQRKQRRIRWIPNALLFLCSQQMCMLIKKCQKSFCNFTLSHAERGEVFAWHVCRSQSQSEKMVTESNTHWGKKERENKHQGEKSRTKLEHVTARCQEPTTSRQLRLPGSEPAPDAADWPVTSAAAVKMATGVWRYSNGRAKRLW